MREPPDHFDFQAGAWTLADEEEFYDLSGWTFDELLANLNDENAGEPPPKVRQATMLVLWRQVDPEVTIEDVRALKRNQIRFQAKPPDPTPAAQRTRSRRSS